MQSRTRAILASFILLVVAAILSLWNVNAMASTFIKRALPSFVIHDNLLQRPLFALTNSRLKQSASPESPSAIYSRTFNTTSPFAKSSNSSRKMANSTHLFDAVNERHSYYSLSDSSPISDDRIQEIVQDTLLGVPSAFNSQTTRLALVLNKEHKKLWQIVREVYKQQLPQDKFEHANQRFNMFEAAYGTVLCYEDTSVVREYQEKFKTYEDKFPGWSEQTNGMHQYVLWTAFEAEGLGANLQHYNPLIDVRLETEFEIPKTWNLKAQLVFGKPEGEKPKAKPKNELEKSLKVFK